MFTPVRSNKTLIAVCGKGGVGKTMFTALMARVVLETDEPGKLLLIDADPAMGLVNALGAKVRRTMGQIREEIIRAARSGNQQEQRQMGNMIDYMVLEALNEGDNFSLLSMGRTETLGCFCPVNDLLRDAIETLSNNFDMIIIDGEAGLEQINRQVMHSVDTLVIISDATSRGIQTAAMIKKMAQPGRAMQCKRICLVFNRVQGNEALLKKYAQEMDMEVLSFIPQDENIAYHDLIGESLMDLPANSSGLAAVRHIVENCILR